MKADRPIVNAGKMMWAQTVKANCRRENKTGSDIVTASMAVNAL